MSSPKYYIDWAFTPEGHDRMYEYTGSFECDGELITYLRRTPRQVVEAGEWERIVVLPDPATRTLVDGIEGEMLRDQR